jgi:multiple sugar transport system ATP-binding protein
MNAGEAQQIDTPLTLYQRPVNRFVAGFMGSPAMNFIAGRLDGSRFISADSALSLRLRARPAAIAGESVEVVLGVRPEHVRIEARGGDSHGELTVDLVEPMGNEMIVYLRTAAHEMVSRVPPAALPAIGESVAVILDLDHLHFFDPATERTLGA